MFLCFRPGRSSLRFIGDQENALGCRFALFPGEQALRDLPHMIRRGYEHEPEE